MQPEQVRLSAAEQEKLEQRSRDELRERIAAVRKERKQDTVATPITAAEISAAQVVLDEAGGGVILVVPETWDLQGGNPAICLTSSSHVSTYTELLKRSLTSYDPGVNRDWLLARMVEKAILIKQSVLTQTPTIRRGIIWHELGHISLGEAENGDVFAHELTCLRKFLGDSAAREYVNGYRKVDYFARYGQDPGLTNLARVLSELGFDLERRKAEMAEKELQDKRRKLKPGFRLNGPPDTYRSRAGADDDPPI